MAKTSMPRRCRRLLTVLFLILFVISNFETSFAQTFDGGRRAEGYTGEGYPDIRAQTWNCGANVRKEWRKTSFVCDPDELLNMTEVEQLNSRLHLLTNTTPCHCQRRSQCTSTDKDGKSYFLGFIVAVAVARKLRITYHDPTETQLKEIAKKFSQTVMGRWALGDCGNSALIFLWAEYKRMYIITGRVTVRYLTKKEVDMITLQVRGNLVKHNYAPALINAIENIEKELMGEPETKVDAGTLSLIISVGVAVILVLIITGCVCAFRCCGNLRPDPETPLGRTLERVDSVKAEIFRRGSQLRHSFSRSPKFGRRSPNNLDSDMSPTNNTQVLLNYGSSFNSPYSGNNSKSTNVNAYMYSGSPYDGTTMV